MLYHPLRFKPDIEEAAHRWEAYYSGDIIDRPLVCVTAPRPGARTAPGSDYRDRTFGDIGDIIDRALINAEATYYAGESMPGFWLSFGPDEVAVFCGAELCWHESSGDTNWSKPFVEDWESALPLRIQEDNWLWLRMQEFYRLAAERLSGKMLLAMPDLHTNMDLVAAVRGPQRLCIDLIERPELVDRAVADSIGVFRQVWDTARSLGWMDEFGYWGGAYSLEGAATLQCDFCCMIGPPMFERWVLPALEAEAAVARHVVHHWDGPGALVHTDALVACDGLQTLSYVPGAGRGDHIDYLDMFRKLQDRGKSLQLWGSPDQVKEMHRALRPERSMYCTWASSPSEADALLEWFVRNT